MKAEIKVAHGNRHAPFIGTNGRGLSGRGKNVRTGSDWGSRGESKQPGGRPGPKEGGSAFAVGEGGLGEVAAEAVFLELVAQGADGDFEQLGGARAVAAGGAEGVEDGSFF